MLPSSACTEAKAFVFLVLHCQHGAGGCTRSWEGTKPAQLTRTDQRDVLYHMVSCSALKAAVKNEEGEHGQQWHVFPQEAPDKS